MLPLGMPLFPKAVTFVVDQAPELRAVTLGSADMYVRKTFLQPALVSCRASAGEPALLLPEPSRSLSRARARTAFLAPPRMSPLGSNLPARS